jgi:hypothetical protein
MKDFNGFFVNLGRGFFGRFGMIFVGLTIPARRAFGFYAKTGG